MIQNLADELEMLQRHIEILQLVIENEPIGIVALSNETGYPHHKVRYSLRILEEKGLIEPTDRGAVTTEETADFVDRASARIEDVVAKLEGMKAGSNMSG